MTVGSSSTTWYCIINLHRIAQKWRVTSSDHTHQCQWCTPCRQTAATLPNFFPAPPNFTSRIRTWWYLTKPLISVTALRLSSTDGKQLPGSRWRWHRYPPMPIGKHPDSSPWRTTIHPPSFQRQSHPTAHPTWRKKCGGATATRD